MVGFFQFFGINFIFWVFVGFMRFVFDTLEYWWDTSREKTLTGLFIACASGIGIAVTLIFFFFLRANAEAAGITSAQEIAALILWLVSIFAGSYFATRLYMREPYLAAAIVCGSMILLMDALLDTPRIGVYFAPLAPEGVFEWMRWIALTVCTGLLGGHIARNFNVQEEAEKRYLAELNPRLQPSDVAVVLAAHNEELVIGTTIGALCHMTTPEHIYIGSDGSKDKTVAIARKLGVHVADIKPNGGKARALTKVLQYHNILDRYKAVLFLDADTRPDKNFFTYALPYFDDPSVVALAGHAKSLWPRHFFPRWNLLVSAYRVRLWRVLQFCLRYGQTWKYTSVSPIIPGGGSIYRTSALRHIEIDVPGLIIEDFNMTFTVHHKKLGKIAFDHRAFVEDQEPFSIRDYIKQIRRWYVGFFQTVRYHGPWISFFYLTMFAFTFELVLSSLLFAMIPFIVVELLFIDGAFLTKTIGTIVGYEFSLMGIIAALVMFDYLITAVVALIERKPMLLIYGILFVFLRYIESIVFLWSLIKGLLFKPKNDGRWVSPKRVAYSSSA